MTELSVIVPIYKVEKYLEKCVDSILAQGIQNMEVILVDDGSPDRCPEICDHYEAKDSRIKVVHQNNQGLVLARKAGLKIASGKYVTYVDGDDWLEGKSLYATLLTTAKVHLADVVVTGYKEGDEKKSTEKSNNIDSGIYFGEALKSLQSKALFSGYYFETGIVPAFWNKLFRRELLVSLGDIAHKDIRMGEDVAVIYPFIASTSCVVVNNEIKEYHYRVTQGSMSRSFDRTYFDRLFFLIEGLRKSLRYENSWIYQINYYMLYVLEVGFDHLLLFHGPKNLISVKSIIEKQIDRFDLVNRLKEIDMNIVGENASYRLNALIDKKVGKYMIYRMNELISNKFFK